MKTDNSCLFGTYILVGREKQTENKSDKSFGHGQGKGIENAGVCAILNSYTVCYNSDKSLAFSPSL